MLKNVLYQTIIVTVLKARGNRALADVNCYCKMTSVVALDGVTSFLSLKDVTQANYWRDFFSAMAESRKKLKTSKFVFVIYCVLESK